LFGLSDRLAPELAVVEFDPEFLAKAEVRAEDLYFRLADLGYRMHSLFGEPVPLGELDVPERNVIGVRDGVTVQWLPKATA
jgi:hypothetical protein